MKLNKSSARGGNSEEIATDVSAHVIAMLTDVATLRDRIWPRVGRLSKRQAMV